MLEDVNANDIDVEAPLFGEGLGLDSIDALELAIAIERRFGVKLGEHDEEARAAFASVRALSKYVLQANPAADR